MNGFYEHFLGTTTVKHAALCCLSLDSYMTYLMASLSENELLCDVKCAANNSNALRKCRLIYRYMSYAKNTAS